LESAIVLPVPQGFLGLEIVMYQVWAVYASGEDELYADGLTSHDAEYVACEMNIAATDLPEGEPVPDYRVLEGVAN